MTLLYLLTFMRHLKNDKETLPLLDSSLISQTNLKNYNYKMIVMNDYIQLYSYMNEDTGELKNKIIKDKNIEKEAVSDKHIKNLNIDFLSKEKETKRNVNELKKIEKRNINRSKLECQRIAKANIETWETFITLTFEENITDINIANKKLNSFFTIIRKKKKDFKYLCIPEFQKRGAVHFHLLTNISINDNNIIYAQNDNEYFKHIKYWNNGFTSVETLKGDPKKVIGYISKYMTKDIDDRLFSKRRYYSSTNLNKPKTYYIDLSCNLHKNFFNNLLENKKVSYKNTYYNPYNNDTILFTEFYNNSKMQPNG